MIEHNVTRFLKVNLKVIAPVYLCQICLIRHARWLDSRRDLMLGLCQQTTMAVVVSVDAKNDSEVFSSWKTCFCSSTSFGKSHTLVI